MKFVALLVIWMVVGIVSQLALGIAMGARSARIERENGIKLDTSLNYLTRESMDELVRFNPLGELVIQATGWKFVLLAVPANAFGWLTWPAYTWIYAKCWIKSMDDRAIKLINEKLAAERLGS